MGKLKAIILDIDGTLLLSNDAHAQAYVDAARDLGIPADFAKIRRLIGKGSDKLIPEAFGLDPEHGPGAELDAAKGKVFKKIYLPTLQAAPGARALLERFRQDGFQLVVATSAGEDDVAKLLDRAGVRDLIEDTASSDDAAESKPDPDIVNAALKKIGQSPGAAVMLGDTPYDVEAAGRAGVRIIAVRCGGWKDRDLEGAAAIYDDPDDMLRHYDEAIRA